MKDDALAPARDLAEQSGPATRARFLLSNVLGRDPVAAQHSRLGSSHSGRAQPRGTARFYRRGPVTASLEERDGTLVPTNDYWTPRYRPMENSCAPLQRDPDHTPPSRIDGMESSAVQLSLWPCAGEAEARSLGRTRGRALARLYPYGTKVPRTAITACS